MSPRRAASPKAGSPKAGSSKAGSSKAGSSKAGSSKAGSSKAGSSKAGSSKGRPGTGARGRNDRLGPDDWTRAALQAIAEGGIANVSIERLARELGATKGSFYWHFDDRPALIAAALERWERDYTDRIVTRLGELDDPREQFRALLETSFEAHDGVLIDANLLADADDPVVGEALERVARKRLAFVDEIFARLGQPGGSDRALLAFTAYLGLSQLRRTAPGITPTGRRSRAYVDHVIEWILGPDGP